MSNPPRKMKNFVVDFFLGHPVHLVFQVRPATERDDRIFSRLIQLDRFVADTKAQVPKIGEGGSILISRAKYSNIGLD